MKGADIGFVSNKDSPNIILKYIFQLFKFQSHGRSSCDVQGSTSFGLCNI